MQAQAIARQHTTKTTPFAPRTWVEKRSWVVPLALVIVGLVARFYMLGNQSLWGDEGVTWYSIKDSLGTCLERLSTEGNQGPLNCVLQWFWSQVFGTSEVGLRSFSATIGALGVASTWLIAAKLANRRVAAIAATMVALSPLWVYYSQEARPYALSLTLVTGAYACAQRLVEGRHIRWPWLIGYVLCASGSILTHYYTFFVLLSIALILWKDRKALATWLGASIIAAIVPIIWLIWEWSSFSDAITGQAIQRLDWGPYLWGLGEAFSKGLSSPNGLPLIFIVFGLGLAVLGALKRESIPLVGWLLLVIVGIQIAGFPPDRPGPWVRYMISALPAFIVLEAIGIERLWKIRALFGAIALVVVLAISGISLWHVYTDPTLARFDFRTPIAQLKASVRPEDRVIVNRGIATFYYYYGDTKPEPIILMPTESTPYPEIEGQIAKASSGARVVYLIKYMPPDFDPGDTIEKWLNNHSTKVADQWVEHIRFITYDFRPTPKPDDQGVRRVEASFGDAIQLIGWTIDPDSKANDIARVTLFWKAKANVPKDYKVFVHLVDAKNPERKVAQHDSSPAMGAQPTTKWTPDAVVSDVHPLVVPKGDWMLSIGMYTTNEPRLIAHIAGKPDDSRVLLGPIHVP